MNKSTNDLKQISEGDDDSVKSGALYNNQKKVLFEKENEIFDLVAQDKLVEIFDIIPTAFCLNKSSASDMKAFKKRFSEMHIGKGLVERENMPDKHCNHN